jgi:hypothetical protein
MKHATSLFSKAKKLSGQEDKYLIFVMGSECTNASDQKQVIQFRAISVDLGEFLLKNFANFLSGVLPLHDFLGNANVCRLRNKWISFTSPFV